MPFKRPIYLDLLKITLPITGLSSICHRLSGIFLLLSLPLLSYCFVLSIDSAQGFLYIAQITQNSLCIAFWLWSCVIAITYHLYSGIRHLLMDLHFFEDLKTARFSAWVVFILFFIEALGFSLWFWGIV